MAHIGLSQLQLVKDTQEFFSLDKILFFDVIIVNLPPELDRGKRRKILRGLAQNGGFFYKEKLYCGVSVMGSPEKLILKLGKNAIPFELIPGFPAYLMYDGKLESSITGKNIYDFGEYYYNKTKLVYEYDFWIERYIKPYEPTPN